MSISDFNHKIQQLSTLLSPENIESTKAFSCFNDKFECSVNDLIQICEISKIENDPKKLIELLLNVSFLSVDCNSHIVKLLVHPDLNVFSFVNIPFDLSITELSEQVPVLKIESLIKRIYKNSLFWIIVTENNDFANELEEALKVEIKHKNNSFKIQYERQKADEIGKNLYKLFSNHTHIKKERKDDFTSVNSNQKLSWRKKSNDTNEPAFISKDKPKDNNYFQRSSNTKPNNVRDRYNSDGMKFSAFKPTKRYEEIEIDLSKINYSLKIKHKFSNGDLLLYYDKFRINKVFDKVPQFTNFVDAICSNNKRKEFNYLKRERSLTFSVPFAYKNATKADIKLNLDAPSFKLPEKNPLSVGNLTGIKLNK